MTKHSRPVTFMERIKAQKVVEALRQYYRRDKVAEILGIPAVYVSTTGTRQKKNRCDENSENYYTPRWAIIKILDYLKIIDSVIE